MDTEFVEILKVLEASLFSTDIQPDMAALKATLRNTWSAGDYDHFSRFMENDARLFYERLNVATGSRLLDVACGSGQLALWAARDGMKVVGVDIAANLVERANVRAHAERLDASFVEGDAEALPFEDAGFDVVTSLIGAMFAPRPVLVARELLRVCKPGGMIAMGNWTQQGFVGQMFRTISRFIAPSGMPAPTLWGDETVVRERFGAGVKDLKMTRRNYCFNYPFSPGDVVEFFRAYYGPTKRAFASLDLLDANELRKELESLWNLHNRANNDVTVVHAEYLEVIAVKR